MCETSFYIEFLPANTSTLVLYSKCWVFMTGVANATRIPYRVLNILDCTFAHFMFCSVGYNNHKKSWFSKWYSTGSTLNRNFTNNLMNISWIHIFLVQNIHLEGKFTFLSGKAKRNYENILKKIIKLQMWSINALIHLSGIIQLPNLFALKRWLAR